MKQTIQRKVRSPKSEASSWKLEVRSKKIIRMLTIAAMLTLNFKFATLNCSAQNIGINSTGATPNASALLDIDAAPGNDKGILIPRVALTITTSNAPIGSGVATSLLIYNTATVNDVSPGYYYWDGSKWVNMSGDGWKLTGNTGTNDATNFIGTTDAQDFVVKTSNTERIRVLSTGPVGIGKTPVSTSVLDLQGDNGASEDFIISDNGGTYSYLYTCLRNTTGTGHMGYVFSQQAGGSHFAGLDFDPDFESLTLRNNYHTSNGFDKGVITFVTRNASGSGERMRVDNDGNLGIGVTSVRSKLNVAGGIGIGTGTGISTTHGTRNSIQINTDTQYGGAFDEHSGALIYSTMPGGWTTAQLDICISNNWGTYNTASPALRIAQTGLTMHGVAVTSDRRLKTNIEKLNYGLKDLMKITPVSYKKHIAKELKKGKVVLEEKGVKRIGFIAQDLYQIIPEVVNKPENEDEEFWSVDYSKMSAVMVKAIQELNNKIELLERELAEMKDSKNSGN